MSEKDREKKQTGELARQAEDSNAADLPADTRIQLGNSRQLDLTGLSSDQINALKQKHGEGMVDAAVSWHKKAGEVRALDATLNTMSSHTSEVAESGQDVTITHTQESDLGRTEVIMGTSDTAKKGKLSRTQTGAPDYTLLWVGLAIFAVLVIALIALAS